MNDLIGTVRTMDSREIAELTGKAHDKVTLDIENQLGAVGNIADFRDIYLDSMNRKRAYYRLPYRETMILISGYSVELRARIIDRWMELERASAPAIPKTFAEALQLAADQAKEIEAKTAALALAAPKVEFFDAVAESKDTISIGELAKALAIPGLGQNNLFKLLREKRILMQDNIPYQDYIDRGYFKIIEQSYPGSSGAIHINMKTVVFQKGVDYVRKIIKE